MIMSFKLPVYVDNKEGLLEFEYEDEIIVVKCDGKHICSLDYYSNFQPDVQQMLDILGDDNEINTTN